MEIALTFTDGSKSTTCMLLDASAGGTMKNKTAAEMRELIDNMFLKEYHPQSKNMGVVKKHGVLILETHDALLESNKLLSDKIEALAKRLEAQEVAKMSINGVSYNFLSKLMKVVHAFQQVWGYLKNMSSIWVCIPDNNEIPNPTISIPAG
jgi:hypothetical protein